MALQLMERGKKLWHDFTAIALPPKNAVHDIALAMKAGNAEKLDALATRYLSKFGDAALSLMNDGSPDAINGVLNVARTKPQLLSGAGDTLLETAYYKGGEAGHVAMRVLVETGCYTEHGKASMLSMAERSGNKKEAEILKGDCPNKPKSGNITIVKKAENGR